MNFLGMTQPASTTLFRSPLTQVFCDPSVYTAAISTPVNLRNNDPDEPKPGDDRQTKEQIKESGHRSTPSVERDRAMPVPPGHRRKNRPNKCRLTEKRQDERYRDALGERVRYSNGRISQGGGCHGYGLGSGLAAHEEEQKQKRPKETFKEA